MIPLVLAATVAVLGPRALPDSDLVVYVPKLAALSQLLPFLHAAGEKSSLLRADSFRDQFHPFLRVDPFDPVELSHDGIDPQGPATISYRGDTQVTCTRLKDVARYRQEADRRLDELGRAYVGLAGPVQMRAARASPVSEHLVAGYLMNGDEVCALSGTSLLPSTLRELSDWMMAPPAPPWRGLGVAMIDTRGMVLGISGRDGALTIRGRTRRLALALTPPAAIQPLAERAGLGVVRMHLDPASASVWIRGQVRRVCRACRTAHWSKFLEALGAAATGEVQGRVIALHPEAPLNRPAGKLGAVEQATWMALRDAGTVQRALQQLTQAERLRETEGWTVVPLESPTMLVRVSGPWLIVASSLSAGRGALERTSSVDIVPAHAMEASLDPPCLADALAGLTVFDAVADPKLAALFALGAEAIPLLRASERISFWADPPRGGSEPFDLEWRLSRAARPARCR